MVQGPNYALAKRLQHWRAMLARSAGCIVSSNVAPSTKTASVTQNKNFAHAYEALPSFRPYEVPGPETSNAVMTALLLHDLNEPMHAGSPRMALANPQQIFSQGAFHGGAWRCAYTFDSIGTLAVLLYYLNTYIVRSYLLLYNGLQTVGWAVIFGRLAAHLAARVASSPWAALGEPLLLFQNLALLEPLHAALGLVRAPFLTTALQVASRVGVVNLVAFTPELHSLPALLLLSFAWSATELVRYSWYAVNLLSRPAAPHTWLRYSTFLVLYPSGVAGELLCIHAALPQLELHRVLGLSLAAVARYAVFPSYVFGLPLLYSHMLHQRARALGSGRSLVTCALPAATRTPEKEV